MKISVVKISVSGLRYLIGKITEEESYSAELAEVELSVSLS